VSALLAKVKRSLVGVGLTCSGIGVETGPSSECPTFPTSFTTALFDVATSEQGPALKLVLHVRHLGVPGVVYLGAEHSHMAIGVCAGQVVHDLLRPQGEAVLQAVAQIFLSQESLVVEGRRLGAGVLQPHVVAPSNHGECELSPGLVGGGGILTPQVLASDAERIGLSVRSTADTPFASLGMDLLRTGALGDEAVFVKVNAAWAELPVGAPLPASTTAVYMTSSTLLDGVLGALQHLAPVDVDHVPVGMGQISLKPASVFASLTLARQCQFAWIDQRGATLPFPFGDELNEVEKAKKRVSCAARCRTWLTQKRAGRGGSLVVCAGPGLRWICAHRGLWHGASGQAVRQTVHVHSPALHREENVEKGAAGEPRRQGRRGGGQAGAGQDVGGRPLDCQPVQGLCATCGVPGHDCAVRIVPFHRLHTQGPRNGSIGRVRGVLRSLSSKASSGNDVGHVCQEPKGTWPCPTENESEVIPSPHPLSLVQFA